MVNSIVFIYSRALDLVILYSLIISLIYFQKIKKNTLIKFFPLYIVICLAVDLVGIFYKHIGIACVNLFVPFEFIFFYHFYCKILDGKENLRILIFLIGVYIIFFPLLLVSHLRSNHTSFIQMIAEHTYTDLQFFSDILIILPVILYYRKLFLLPPKKLNQDPVFLIMTGIMFCFSFIIPLQAIFILVKPFNKETFLILYILNTFGYIFLNSAIIRAYLILR